MPSSFYSKPGWLLRCALLAMLAFSALLPGHVQAALHCEVTAQTCLDSAVRDYGGVPVAPPVISGYPSACWKWSRTYDCLDDVAKYSCSSSQKYEDVKTSCNLVKASVTSTRSINGTPYVTNAAYDYVCDFTDVTDQLTADKATNKNGTPPPAGSECVTVDSTVTNTGTTTVIPAGSPGYTNNNGTFTPTQPTQTIVDSQTYHKEYTCYEKPVKTCKEVCYADGIGGQVVPCTKPLTECVTQNDTCNAVIDPSNPTASHLQVGPDGRCVASTETQICRNGEPENCVKDAKCNLATTRDLDFNSVGIPQTQEQTYNCQNTATDCLKTATVNSCTGPQAWGLDNMHITETVGQGLGEANAAMAKVEGIQKGIKKDDLFIFSGQDLRCRYPVGNWLNTVLAVALVVVTGGAAAAVMAAVIAAQDAQSSKAFGTNCCKDYIIEGSDAWYKLGTCTADEVKLSVARSKNLTRYMGEYCSKRSGFPIKQCKEKTRTFCAFDDMLAFTVNEQGRKQLDDLANADKKVTDSTDALNFNMFGAAATGTPYSGLNTGHWTQVTAFNGSKIWRWEYPRYCLTSSSQAAAYAAYNEEVNNAVSTAGYIPPKDATGKYDLSNLTDAQKKEILAKIQSVPEFQECAAIPGELPFMTCSLANDACDTAKMPAGPGIAEVDETATSITSVDPNWRIQSVRTFYKPTDPDVKELMPTDSSFAAVTSAVNEMISSKGSCKEATGACLFSFFITDKTNSQGATSRATETVRFPLYMNTSSAEYPTIDFMEPNGGMASDAYATYLNRGQGNPTIVGNQRYIFHPNATYKAPTTGIHDAVLLEWAYEAKVKVPLTTDGPGGDPSLDYAPLVVPTHLPKNTGGWWPFTLNGQKFYLSGSCDVNSRWCTYTIEQDLVVQRHPWGDAKNPRCWGFTLDQMAVLDFDKMDLSRWINSLNLGDMSSGVSAQKAAEMTDAVTSSSQAVYTGIASGTSLAKPDTENTALQLSTDTLPNISNEAYQAYKLNIAVPSNWPRVYTADEGVNDNPVTNVRVNWGGASTATFAMTKDASGTAYLANNDYGDYKPGTYKVTVTLDTAKNGSQTLTRNISITPYSGSKPAASQLDLSTTNSNAAATKTYTPTTATSTSTQSSLVNAQGATVGETSASGATK